MDLRGSNTLANWSHSIEYQVTEVPFESTVSVPYSSPSSNSTMEDAEDSRRIGVDSREEVLRQIRENDREIIEIDPDPAPTDNHAREFRSYQPDSFMQQIQPPRALPLVPKRTRDPDSDAHIQPAKQRKLLDDVGHLTDSTQTEEEQSSLEEDGDRRPGVCPNASSSVLSPLSREVAGVLNVEDRETRIALVRAAAYQTHLAKRDREAEQRMLKKRFYGVDLEDSSKKTKSISKPRLPARTKAEVQNDLRKLMGTARQTATSENTNSDELERSMDEHNGKSGEKQPGNFPIPTLSALHQVGSATKKSAIASKSEDLDLELFDNLPEQEVLENLALPKHFQRYNGDEKKLFIERETKKEREKDLELIRTVVTLGAQLGSLNALDTSDPKLSSHLTFLKRFTEAVLEHQKSAKPIRGRMRSIRDTFKRRLDSIGEEPNEEAADDYLPFLLQPHLFDKLSSDSIEVKDRLSYLQPECNRINSYHHHKFDPRKNRSCARVSLSTKDSASKLVQSDSSTGAKPLTTKQRLAKLHALRDQYNQKPQDREDEVEVIDLGPSRGDDDDDSEVSEEDEGENFMRPAGFQEQPQPVAPNKEVSPEEVNRIENDRQQAKVQSISQTQPSQGVNQQLLDNMLAKRQQQGHLKSQGVQKSDPQVAHENRRRKAVSASSLRKQATASVEADEPEDSEDEANYNIEQESSQEFDDSDIDAEDDDVAGDEEDDNEPVCKRYITKGVCYGLSKKLDEAEYLLGKFLKKEEAREKVYGFKNWVKDQLLKCRPELKFGGFKETTSETKGSLEQKVIFGDSEDIVCRAWFEEELHSPSEEAYQKAKVYRACQATPIWFVDWRRTITPYEKPEEDEKSDDVAMNDSDSSKTLENESNLEEGPSMSESSSVQQTSNPDSTTREPTITRPTPDQLRFFSTRSLANRHGKDIFMRWYIDRLRHPDDHRFISVEDNAMEEQLKEIGDQSCWSREEEFYRPDENVPGGEAKVIDHLHVWVREGKCSGPRN